MTSSISTHLELPALGGGTKDADDALDCAQDGVAWAFDDGGTLDFGGGTQDACGGTQDGGGGTNDGGGGTQDACGGT